MSPRRKSKKSPAAKIRRKRRHFAKEKEVVIHGQSAISVNPDPLHLSRAGSEEARWKHAHGKLFFVQFQGESPFADHIFFTGKAHSGKIVYGGPCPQGFKYRAGVTGSSLDPQVIINP